jgi:hypothetical protein
MHTLIHFVRTVNGKLRFFQRGCWYAWEDSFARLKNTRPLSILTAEGVNVTLPPFSPELDRVGSGAFLSPEAHSEQAKERQLLMENRPLSDPSPSYRRAD